MPSPVATAAAQTTSNVDTAAAQAALNNVNTNTPYGSTNYAITGHYTDPNGQSIPTYTQNTSLTPLAQSILTGSETTANMLVPTAETLAQQAGTSTTTPLNFNTADSATLNSSPQQMNQQATNAIYGQEQSFLNPQWNQQQTQLQDQLSRQGIPVGSAAYNNAMTQLDNARTQAYQSAQDSAISGGSSAASNLFGMALQGQQQNVAQQQLAQSNPISLLQSLFGSTPPTPQQPIASPGQTSVSPTNTIGAQQLSQNAAEANYQAQVSNQNADIGGLASIASVAAIAI